MGDKAVYFVLGCFVGGMAYAVWRNKQHSKTVETIKEQARLEGRTENGLAFRNWLAQCATMNLSAGQAYNWAMTGELR